MLLDHLNVLFQHFQAFESKFHALVHLNLWDANKLYPISSCFFVKLRNAFVFPDPEPSIIKSLYLLYEMQGHFLLCFS